MYGGNTISVNADSCRVTTPSEVSIEAVVFACDAPEEKAALIAESSPVPVIFDVYGSLEHPVMQSFINAVTYPIPSEVNVAESTNFEALCATRSVSINGDLDTESRARKH